MDISSIDELLTESSNTPEVEEKAKETEIEQEQNFDYGEEENEIKEQEPEEPNDEEPEESVTEDDYGTPKEELSKSMQRRLERQAESLRRQHEAEIEALRAQLQRQGASREVQKAADDFEYNPEAEGNWQEQLQSFIKKTVYDMSQENVRAQQERQNRQAHQEFERKFVEGMDRYQDFKDVVGSQPIDDAMVLALRAVKDPAAFIYAAAKRQPEELQRIAKIQDPYARVAEMGKLEERMRRNKATTKAPRPLGITKDDASIKIKQKDSDSIEDLIAKSEAKKIQKMNALRRR